SIEICRRTVWILKATSLLHLPLPQTRCRWFTLDVRANNVARSNRQVRFANQRLCYRLILPRWGGQTLSIFELLPSYPRQFDGLMIPLFFWEFDVHLW